MQLYGFGVKYMLTLHHRGISNLPGPGRGAEAIAGKTWRMQDKNHVHHEYVAHISIRVPWYRRTHIQVPYTHQQEVHVRERLHEMPPDFSSPDINDPLRLAVGRGSNGSLSRKRLVFGGPVVRDGDGARLPRQRKGGSLTPGSKKAGTSRIAERQEKDGVRKKDRD